MWKAGDVDEATWAALTVVLTVLGVVWTVVAFRRRGAANGLRALGFTLLPAAAWLTGTLRMFTEIGSAVSRWATSLVLDPRVWTGVGLAGTAAVLIVLSGYLRARQLARGQGRTPLPEGPRGSSGAVLAEPRGAGSGEAVQPRRKGTGDSELDEIEELLRRRGIQ